MRKITDSLYATELRSFSRFKPFHSNAFYLKRPCGNHFVLYNTGHLEFEEHWLRAEGGVSRQYLSHSHEAGSTCNWLKENFSNLTYIHRSDALNAQRECEIDGTFNQDERIGTDFHIIHTPGHTPGSTCFYWVAPNNLKVMFVGDILVPDKRGEFMLFMDDHSKKNEACMERTLVMLYDYDVDLIIPRGSEGDIEWLWSPHEEWTDIIDKAIVRLRTKLFHFSKRI